MKAKQAQHHAEQALATQKQCDAHELALQGKLETASTAEAQARKEASSILDVARQEASTILEEAKGRVTAAEREATTIEGEVAALRAKCAAEASTHDARVAEARKVTAALEKDAEAWAGRAKASREECERAERDLSDLRDQNAAQSTALIKATDTAQAPCRDAMLGGQAPRTRGADAEGAEEAAARDAGPWPKSGAGDAGLRPRRGSSRT